MQLGMSSENGPGHAQVLSDRTGSGSGLGPGPDGAVLQQLPAAAGWAGGLVVATAPVGCPWGVGGEAGGYVEKRKSLHVHIHNKLQLQAWQ